MTTYTLPAKRGLVPASQALYLTPIGGMTRSPLTGDTKTVGIPGSWWTYELTYPEQTWDERDELQGLIGLVTRSEHRLALWDLSRPRPRGTCSVSGVTLAAAAAQFAQTVTLAGCGAGRTLLASDMLGIAGQLCRVALPATANASGVMTVTLESDLRRTVAAGNAVVLDKPTALFVAPDPIKWPRRGERRCPTISIQLAEVTA